MHGRRRQHGRTADRGADAGTGYPRLRLFRSDWLERLTMVTPRTFALTWAVLLPLVGWAGWGATGPVASIGLVLLGLLVWSLFEYGMHRFIFHLEPRSDLGRWSSFVMHGNHHHDPGDPHRSLMPPMVSVSWSAAIGAVFALLFGKPGLVLLLGFLIGYVTYDTVHYACHQLPVRGRVLRALRRHHLRHHFGRQDGNYAITTVFWDHLFGSYVSAKTAATTPELRQPS